MKVLVSKKTGNYYYAKEGQDYHCKEGIIKKEDLDSNDSIVFTNLDREFFKFNANFNDLKVKMKRGPQIITVKDLGYIFARSGLSKDSIVIEAGGGSGGATSFFSRSCKEVHTFEVREDNCVIIKKNIEYLDLDNVKLINGDLKDYISDEKDIDMVLLDMPEPVNILKEDLSCVKNGQYIVCYVPSVSQIIEISDFVRKNSSSYYLEEVSEVGIRYWTVWERVSRPQSKKEMDHSAFLVFIRKI